MISIRNSADLTAAMEGPLDPVIRALLAERRDQLLEGTDVDLGELVHIIVAQRGDALAILEAAAGFPLITSLDGFPFGHPDYVPHFEWVEKHERWIEAVIVLNDDGFSLALFVPDCVCTDPALLLPLLAQL